MHECPRCHRKLAAMKFYRHSGRLSGHSILCKSCYRAYESSPGRRAKRTWNTIHARVRLQSAYQGIEIRMTREAFLKWAIPEYTKWMTSNQGITPSLDRINAAKHYELGNLRIISRSENARLA